ncbi:MAG TPA: NUDIX hydrolase [Parachlamydiales bacterium]|nr:NUDIX hydrolase [Parachlamydiales bacterium]
MKRKPLLDLLRHYSSSFPEEMEFKARMLAFVEAHEECFERSLEIGHVTASCWLLNREGSKALLLHHAKLGRWFQLGGHAVGHPDVLEVAVKEAREESGIEEIRPISSKIFDLDIHLIPENSKEKAHLHYDVRFLLQVGSDEEVKSNRESKQLLWIGKDPKESPTDNPSILRMMTKWGRLT